MGGGTEFMSSVTVYHYSFHDLEVIANYLTCIIWLIRTRCLQVVLLKAPSCMCSVFVCGLSPNTITTNTL